MEIYNFFNGKLPAGGEESFEELLRMDDCRVERIISFAHSDAEDQWYDQDHDEWVMLVRGEARLVFEGLGETTLNAGDCCHIPAHQRHRISYTSSEPPCYWLALHGGSQNT